MTNKNNNNLDELIYNSIKIEDKPTKQLNDSLKAKIYEKENMQKATGKIRAKYFVYLFMSLNIILSLLICISTVIFIKNIYLCVIILCLVLSYILSSV